MRRLLILLLVIVACATVGRRPPGVITIHAQSLPVTKTVAWDANPASDAIVNYTVTLDAGPPVNTANVTQAVIFATAGTHVIHLTATNLWGTSPETTLTVNVVMPARPTSIRLQ